MSLEIACGLISSGTQHNGYRGTTGSPAQPLWGRYWSIGGTAVAVGASAHGNGGSTHRSLLPTCAGRRRRRSTRAASGRGANRAVPRALPCPNGPGEWLAGGGGVGPPARSRDASMYGSRRGRLLSARHSYHRVPCVCHTRCAARKPRLLAARDRASASPVRPGTRRGPAHVRVGPLWRLVWGWCIMRRSGLQARRPTSSSQTPPSPTTRAAPTRPDRAACPALPPLLAPLCMR